MKLPVLPALLLLSLLPAFAAAENLRVLNTTVLEYRGDNRNVDDKDDDFGLGLNKLYLDGQMENTSVGVQVDSVVFSNFPDVPKPTPSSPSEYRSEARLERISVVQRLGDVSFNLGDSHLQLGRGIALALRRVDELGTDQALRGGGVGYQGDAVSGKVFAGRTNLANLDGVTQKFLEDPDDVLVGASATLHLGRADVSVHGLMIRTRIPTTPEFDEDGTQLGGAYLDLPVTDWLSLYVEGAFEQYRIVRTDYRGSAAYTAADLDLRFVSLLVEGLYLDQFQVWGSKNGVLQRPTVYNQPPTLERIDQEVLDNENVRGGRVKLSRSFLDGSLVLYTSGMLRQFGRDAATSMNAIHGYGGFELTYDGGRSRWYASAGYREEIQVRDGYVQKTMEHAETDWVQSIGGPWALHLTVGHEQRTLDEKGYMRGTTLIGFDRAGWGSLMAEVGYDTQNPKTQQAFLAGVLAWTAADWMTLKAIVGSQRGGIKCIGGVCRDFPAFSGARMEATLQHDML
ncbi:MAG TPA: hypothetical protein VGD74_05020 [Vulgatibacter sp.]